MTTYVNPFTGQTIQPSQVGYELLTISTDTTLQWPVNGNDSLVVANIIEVNATVGGLNLFMPAATQVSVGQSILFRNVGSNTFTVVKSDGATIVSVASGIAEYVYVTDNTTIPGSWDTVTFGAGVSQANAATLAGYGIKAINSTLNQSYPVVNYYSNTTLADSARAEFVVWQGGAGTLTLPPATTVGSDWFCNIRNNGTGILDVQPQGTNTIDGQANAQLQLGESFVIVSNGTDFNTFGYGRSIQFAFTQLALVVTGGTLTESSIQASNTIQEFTGVLTSNQIIVVPATVQLYSITNNTTGAFTFTVKTPTPGGATVQIQQGNSLIVISDGTNCYNAASGSSSSINSLTLGNGTLSVPSLKFSGDVNTGLYLPSSGNMGFVVGNQQVGYTYSGGLLINQTVTALGGIQGGTF